MGPQCTAVRRAAVRGRAPFVLPLLGAAFTALQRGPERASLRSKGVFCGGSGCSLPARHPLPPQVPLQTPRVLRGCEHPGFGFPGPGFVPS